jgi:hypothetical protein
MWKKKKLNIMKRCLFEILRSARSGLQRQYHQLNSKTAIMEANIKDQEEAMTFIDAEKAEVI